MIIKVPKKHKELYLRAKKRKKELLNKNINTPIFDLMMQDSTIEKEIIPYKGFRL